jgi:GTP-binding protein Era
MSDSSHKSGYAAIVGKPNVGKSTLMNALIGAKISITTHKPQTTRHQVTGIYSEDNAQFIFLDTPGIISPKYQLQKTMMRFVERARQDADIVLFIAEAGDARYPGRAFETLEKLNKPVLLIINKIDKSSIEKEKQLAERLNERCSFDQVIYTSATRQVGIKELKDSIIDYLPEGPPFYPKDIISKHPVRFFVSEIIREQLFLQFHQELPYSCTVNINDYEERDDLDYIDAEVVVNRKSQKGMLIGKGGKAIKKLGTNARKVIEDFVGKKVFLDLNVKVREKWRENQGLLKQYGYR